MDKMTRREILPVEMESREGIVMKGAIEPLFTKGASWEHHAFMHLFIKHEDASLALRALFISL